MAKDIDERIDKFLIGDISTKEPDKVDELSLTPNEAGIKPGEYNNLSTGLRRIQFRLEKANTPQKYVDAFSVINQLLEKFPLKAKVIWQTVANSYSIRFGQAVAPTSTPASVTEPEEESYQ